VCNKALVLTAVLFFSNTFHNITGIDEARQLKQNNSVRCKASTIEKQELVLEKQQQKQK